MEDHYNLKFYEAIDAIVQAIITRFDQPSLKVSNF